MAAEHLTAGVCQLLQVNLCGNSLPVYIASDNSESMEGKDKHGQVGTSIKEFINKEKINKKNFLFPCGKNKLIRSNQNNHKQIN